MSYRMIYMIRRLMCDKFSVLCNLAELNEKQLREDERMNKDKLDAIFEMQANLDDRIVAERGIEKSLSEWVIWTTIAMESEIDEIRREVDWKWWKNPQGIDEERLARLQGEVIDMWHFLPSLSLRVGLTADDVHRLYMEKNAENHARQDGKSDKEGYEVKEAE
ncbi:dUTPase [Neobacillus sp. 19]|uniref:dUTPase n=1 Tax=Neobacillus sp. 19 TaxID=3394458 RepID=UPI003BF70298